MWLFENWTECNVNKVGAIAGWKVDIVDPEPACVNVDIATSVRLVCA